MLRAKVHACADAYSHTGIPQYYVIISLVGTQVMEPNLKSKQEYNYIYTSVCPPIIGLYN